MRGVQSARRRADELKEILAVEEEHADDLASLLDGVGS